MLKKAIALFLLVAGMTACPFGAFRLRGEEAAADTADPVYEEIAAKNDTAAQTKENLWKYGDVEFTEYQDFEIELPAGEYVISAKIFNRDASPYFPMSYRVSILHEKTEMATLQLAGEGVEGAGYFVVDQNDTTIRLFASNVKKNAKEHACRWQDVILVEGKYKGSGSVKGSDEIARIENQVLTKNMRYDFIAPTDDLRNILIECRARWSGEETDEYHVPEIRFFFLEGGQSSSGWYMIGEKDCAVHQQWRMPPFPGYDSQAGTNHFKVAVDVPEGLTLTIEKLIVKYDDAYCRPFSGLRIDTYLGFMGYPAFSIHAFNAAARCGASYCIVIPKLSSDGVWFAYHDDTFDEATTLLRNADGTKIQGSEYNGKPFNQIPWSWLKTLDSGIYRNKIFAGTRLMTIETFFDKCNRTGIHPVISVHPSPNREETESLYLLAQRYNLLDKLTLLPSIKWFTKVCYPLFGNEIEMYKFSLGRNKETMENLQALIDTINGVEGLDKSKVCIAFWADSITPELIEATRKAGFRVGIHQYKHTTPSGKTTHILSAADYLYYQKLGVTVFTDHYNASMGLNW